MISLGLVINQEKTVYMHSGKDKILHQDFAIGNYVIKRVDNFKYLGTMVNEMNNRSVEVKARLTMANRAYYGLQNHMKSRIISRNTKTLLYKTLIRPVLAYGHRHGCYVNKMNIVLVSLSVKSSGEFRPSDGPGNLAN